MLDAITALKRNCSMCLFRGSLFTATSSSTDNKLVCLRKDGHFEPVTPWHWCKHYIKETEEENEVQS